MRRAGNRKDIAPVVAEGTRHGCGGKRVYESHATATKMAKRTRRQYENRVEAYRCRACGRWHVGEK